MLFSSSLFLFLFLPVVLLIYILIKKEWRNYFLLIASLIFYAWDEVTFVFIMLFSILMNYTFALVIDKIQKKGKKKAIVILTISIIFNLGLIGFYKYANFFIDNLNKFFGFIHLSTINLASIPLPVGISFFTFQAMSYVIDVYRKEAPAQRKLSNVALYIALFPQLIAGPIVRYHDIAKQIIERKVGLTRFTDGIKRFILGLSKKLLIANTVAITADKIFALTSNELTFSICWLGVICYSLQIYFDFSGYSDMAIGLGKMFGFEFLENFNFPYISKSIREFWRRWHISLSTWFRDYLYIPLGGNRISKSRTYINLIFVFFLCGLWHGASWTFVVWGLWHGFFLALERTKFGSLIDKLWSPLRWMYMMIVVMIGWVIFRSETFAYALTYLRNMLGMGVMNGLVNNISFYINYDLVLFLIIGIISTTPLLYRIRKKFESGSEKQLIVFRAVEAAMFILLLVLCSMYLASTTNNPFIYFRF